MSAAGRSDAAFTRGRRRGAAPRRHRAPASETLEVIVHHPVRSGPRRHRRDGGGGSEYATNGPPHQVLGRCSAERQHEAAERLTIAATDQVDVYPCQKIVVSLLGDAEATFTDRPPNAGKLIESDWTQARTDCDPLFPDNRFRVR